MVRDAENSYLTAEGADVDHETTMNHLLGSSITYRIAMGPQQGRKVFTLQTLPDCGDEQFAPNSHHRARVTPAKRGKGKKTKVNDQQDQTPAERHAAMTWAQRPKRVFNNDIETCSECGGEVHPMAGSGRLLPLALPFSDSPVLASKRLLDLMQSDVVCQKSRFPFRGYIWEYKCNR